MSDLACGGRGPCCHVGYPHRHCEHCDTVIALQHCHHYYQPYYGAYYQGLSNLGGLSNQIQGLANQAFQQSPLQALSNGTHTSTD